LSVIVLSCNFSQPHLGLPAVYGNAYLWSYIRQRSGLPAVFITLSNGSVSNDLQ